LLVVGIGGTLRESSSSETALRVALESCEYFGHEVRYFTGRDLLFPMYEPGCTERTSPAAEFLDAVRRADALAISTPGYHGSLSGLIKNALDYLEDLRDSERPYLEGRTVGCISVAYGWQAAVGALGHLRAIVHALRGWPTPYGAAINAQDPGFGSFTGELCAGRGSAEMVGRQVRESLSSSPWDVSGWSDYEYESLV
jgi:FMN reductase